MIDKRVNGTISEKYLWKDAITLLAVYDASDNLILRFNYADGRMPISMAYNGNTYYSTYDQIGSLKGVTDAAGNVIKRIDYDSYGSVISDTNPSLRIPFGFAGGLYDKDSGLIRFGARDYDPTLGRWTAKDPIDFLGGDTNLYGYVLNNPVYNTDPEGNLPPPVWGAIVIGMGFIAYEIVWWYQTTHPQKPDTCQIKNDQPDNKVPGSPGRPPNFPPYQAPPPPPPSITGR